MRLYLTPAAIGYLAQWIIAVLIGGYLWWKARQPHRPRHIVLLAGFYTAMTAFIASLLAETALLPTGRFYVVLVQNTLLAQGLTYREVGQELYLSEATIKYHMKQILDCLQLRNRRQAVAYARRSGFAP